MNRQEVGQLLTIDATVTGRTIDEPTILVWHKILEHMPYDMTLDAIQEHYAESTKWVMPANLVTRVRQIMSFGSAPVVTGQRAIGGNPDDLQRLLDDHCGFGGCPCTHTAGCVKGWIEASTLSYDRVRPCPICRPILDNLLNQARDAQEQTRLLHMPRQGAR